MVLKNPRHLCFEDISNRFTVNLQIEAPRVVFFQLSRKGGYIRMGAILFKPL